MDDQKNLVLIREALFEVTGRRLAVTTVESDAQNGHEQAEGPPSEDQVISLLKDTLNATEVEEPA